MLSPPSSKRYLPRTAFLKSLPGPGFGPIHVARIASATFFPGSVPFTLPLTSTVVPLRSSDRKSTRLNSSHDQISYAVFCLKKKKKQQVCTQYHVTTR